MKKTLIAFTVVMLLVATATPALAAGGPPRGGSQSGFFTLTGVITAINGTVVTVQVVGGGQLVREYVGQTLALQTTSSTRYLLKTETCVVPITLADLEVGQNVSVSGTVADGVWTATRITVGATVIHLP